MKATDSDGHPLPVPKQVPLSHGKRLLTLQETAQQLAISIASVRRLIAADQLPVVRVTRRLRVDSKDLERLIEQAKHRQRFQ